MLISRRKRYLSGSDWGLCVFDHMLKIVTSLGNICQVTLALDRSLSGDELRARLERFLGGMPVVWGRITRDFKLTPYWKIPARARRDVRLSVTRLPGGAGDETLMAALTANANRPFPSGRGHLDFHLFELEGRGALAMRFDHRLFDARGAESFLELFQKSLDDAAFSGDITFTSSMELTQWNDKFMAGRNVNRAFLEMSRLDPRTLPLPPRLDQGYAYRFLAFDERETAVILDHAHGRAGYMMESAFFLAAITRAVHALCEQHPDSGSCYLVPVTMDLRPGKEPLQEVFFNYVSYLFYRIPAELGDDEQGLIALFKQQMYDQVKSGLPRDLAKASLLSRIAPLRLMDKPVRKAMGGKLASFAYSHLGKNFYRQPRLMDAGVENIIHMPRIPVPPGLGFFSSMYGNRLNLVISCLAGLLDDAQLTGLATAIRQRLETPS